MCKGKDEGLSRLLIQTYESTPGERMDLKSENPDIWNEVTPI